MSVDFCGVAEHDDDCLCDVVIPHPTGWVGDAVQDMWLGQEIVDMMGYQQEWDNHAIVSYLEDLVYAKDNWARGMFLLNSSKGQIDHNDMRKEIARRLQSSESKSIVTVCDELGLSHGDLIKILFMNRRNIPLETILEFERDVRNRTFPSAYGFGIKYGMPYKSAHKLHSYWGVPYSDSQDRRNPETVLMDELLAVKPPLSNREISDIIYEKLGVRVRYDRIRERKYILKKTHRL